MTTVAQRPYAPPDPASALPPRGDVEQARLTQLLLALLVRQAALLEGARRRQADGLGLTARETTVLRLLSEGRTAVSIAHALHVSPRTVHSHLAHIYRKLGVCDRMRAVLVATELGVLDPTPATAGVRATAAERSRHVRQ